MSSRKVNTCGCISPSTGKNKAIFSRQWQAVEMGQRRGGGFTAVYPCPRGHGYHLTRSKQFSRELVGA